MPGSLAAEISAGALVAFLSANFSLGYAALLFAGTPPASQATGLVMILTGSIVAACVGTRLSSLPFSVMFADGTLVALLASVATEIVADLPGAPEENVTATLAVMLMLGTGVTGLALWLIGAARAGGVVRYIPFQVMAGVLAASGWSLSSGGAAVATGHTANLALLADPALLAKLAPAVTLAAAMLAISSWIRHPAALPAAIALAIGLHHAGFLWFGWTIAAQRDGGWLLALPEHLSVSMPWSPHRLDAVNWRVLVSHAPSLLALVPVTAICLLLGLTGIEASTGRDARTDRDLKANGIAAMATGALGGVLAITSVSRTLLLYGLGVRGRVASLFAGVAAGVVPLLWPALLGFVPRFVVGGLLLFVGLGMLRQWVLHSRRQLTLSEWLTVLAVLAAAARFGLIIGASTGLLLGCIAFAVIYSRASPIRARYRGDAAHSRVDRSEPEQALLAEQADTVLVMHLQGFVFFGTASRLVDEISREIAAAPGRLRHLLLEFGNVQGIDGSALASFERLQRVVATERIALAFAAMSEPVAARLAGLSGGAVHTAPTLDAALEWRETALLAALPPLAARSVAALLAAEFDTPEQAGAFLALLEGGSFPPDAVMMPQGELSDDLMFIEHGRARVTVRFAEGAAPVRVRTYGAGTMVGEIGFFLGLPRTATVTADGPCGVLRLTRESLRRLEDEHPAAALAFQRAVLRRLGARLVDKDQLIAALVLNRSG